MLSPTLPLCLYLVLFSAYLFLGQVLISNSGPPSQNCLHPALVATSMYQQKKANELSHNTLTRTHTLTHRVSAYKSARSFSFSVKAKPKKKKK